MKKFLFFSLLLLIWGCGSDDDNATPETPVDTFDRQAMLINWADDIIVPAYTLFAEKTTTLAAAGQNFSNTPTADTYTDLVDKWEAAYLQFQDVSMFEIGKAEQERFTYNLNIYPTDVDGINANIEDGNYNLALPSEVDRQGFPALDYLLFGVAENTDAILTFYQSNDAAAEYLHALTNRINDLAQLVLADWQNGYRDEFIENKGNSALSSVDKLVNDYIFYYEKHLRAGKIGIPAGVFSGNQLPENVEAYYRKDFSKALFMRALYGVQDFFNGVHYKEDTEGVSLNSYLEYLGVKKNELPLTTVINNQFDEARTTAQGLSDNFAEQVMTDNAKMLAAYDALQLNVVHIKVDLLQALNINVDYVDADGD